MITVENKVNGLNELSSRFNYRLAQPANVTRGCIWHSRRRFR